MLNGEEIPQKVKEWFENGRGNPFMLELKPTNKCNLRCPTCVARGHPHHIPGKELSAKDYKRILDEAAMLDVRYVQIVGGGEPFIRKPLVLEMMRCIKGHGMEGFIVTNGTLLDKEIIEDIVEMGWDAVFFSLDASTPELNDFLRSKKGCFEKTTSAIRQLVDLKERKGTPTPLITLGPVLSHHNCGEIPKLVALGAELGVDCIVFQPVEVPPDATGRPFKLTDEDLKIIADAIPKAERIADRAGVRTNLTDLWPAVGEIFEKGSETNPAQASLFKDNHLLSLQCYFPWFYMGIDANGDVYPCSHTHPQACFGNIRRRSLREVWYNNSEIRAIRESFLRQYVRQGPSSIIGGVLGNIDGKKSIEREVRFCKEQLKRYPKHPLLLRYLGEFLIGCGDYRGAIQLLERGGEGAGWARNLPFLLGRCHFEMGEYGVALKRFKASLEEATSEDIKARNWYSMALCYQGLKRHNRMEQCLAKARECSSRGSNRETSALEPWPSPFFHEVFRHLKKRQEYRRGLRFGIEQLKRHPGCAALHHHLGEFHMENGEYDKAIGYLSRVAELDQRMEWTRFSLGKCYFLTNRLREAEQAFRQNLRLTSDRLSHYHSWLLLAVCHLEFKNYERMNRCLAEAEKLMDVRGQSERWDEEQSREFRARWPAPFFHQAFRHFREQEKYREGILFGTRMLKKYPMHPLLHHYLGEFSMELGEYDRAIGHLSRAAELDPVMEWTRFSLGKCYFLTNRLREAEQAFRQNLRLTSDRLSHYHSWLLLAVCHLEFKNYERMNRCLAEAEKLMDVRGQSERWDEEQSREFRARWPAPFFHQAFRHFREQEKYREGILFGTRMLKKYPMHPLLHHYLGKFSMELGEYDRAIGHLSRAAELDPDREWTSFSLGKCYVLTGRPREAEQAFRQNLRLTSNRLSHYQSWLLLAVCHIESKEYSLMRRCLAEAAKLMDALKQAKRWDEEQFRQFRARWPAPFFHEAFGYLSRQGKYKEGILFGTRMLKKYPMHPLLHHHIGEFHMELEEYEKAIEHLSLAVKLNPIIEWSRFSLGKCYFLTGRLKEAEQALQKNLKLTSDRQSHYHSWLFLAMVHHARGEQASCRKALDSLKVFNELPDDPLPLEREFLKLLWKEHSLPAGLAVKKGILT